MKQSKGKKVVLYSVLYSHPIGKDPKAIERS